jgi:chromosome segregation ATPase
MYSLLTLTLTALGAAFAGVVGGWYGIRDRKYLPLKIQHDENGTALMQLTDAYTAGKAQYADLQTRFKDTELANSKTSADFKIISDEQAVLTTEFNIYKSESEQKTAELEAEIKKLTESVEKYAEAETRFNKLSKEYASAIE